MAAVAPRSRGMKSQKEPMNFDPGYEPDFDPHHSMDAMDSMDWQHEKMVHSNFYNAFEDDFDDTDMATGAEAGKPADGGGGGGATK